MDKTEKCYLLHVNLGGKPSKTRIKEAATQIKELVSQLSPDNQLAYTSGDGSTFGFLLKSRLWASQIAYGIYSPGENMTSLDPKPIIPSPLRHEDSLLVLEVGDDVSDIGKAKIRAWFQHHRTTKSASRSQAASGEGRTQGQLADQLAKIKDKLGK